MIKSNIPLVGFAAYSGTGKTTLLKKVISIFKEKSIRTGVIKHAHHTFEVDYPGKDSYELRKAGAAQVLVGSDMRWALMVETGKDYSLEYYLKSLDPTELDLVLVEGFKNEKFPKIELHRPSLGHDLLSSQDKKIIAIATDDKSEINTELQLLDINQPLQVVNFIIDHIIDNHKIDGKVVSIGKHSE